MAIGPLALAPTKVHITTSEGFRALARESKGRNQGPSQRCLNNLDPDGYHVVLWRTSITFPFDPSFAKCAIMFLLIY